MAVCSRQRDVVALLQADIGEFAERHATLRGQGRGRLEGERCPRAQEDVVRKLARLPGAVELEVDQRNMKGTRVADFDQARLTCASCQALDRLAGRAWQAGGAVEQLQALANGELQGIGLFGFARDLEDVQPEQ